MRDIDYIEACGNYAEIHAGGRTHLVRMTMQELEQRLDPSMFVRIHRSTIVHIDRIRNIVAASHGDFDLTLTMAPFSGSAGSTASGCSGRCYRPSSIPACATDATTGKVPPAVKYFADVVEGEPSNSIGLSRRLPSSIPPLPSIGANHR